jgi:hypothetical protein
VVGDFGNPSLPLVKVPPLLGVFGIPLEKARKSLKKVWKPPVMTTKLVKEQAKILQVSAKPLP